MPSAAFFSLNRDEYGPAYQWSSNRTPAPFRYNDWFISLFLTTGCLLLLLCILLPTLRRKWQTTSLVVLSLAMGTAMVLCCVEPEWQNGYAYILAPLKVQETDTLPLWLGVHVGLQSVNITLTLAQPPSTNMTMKSFVSRSKESTNHSIVPQSVFQNIEASLQSIYVTLPFMTSPESVTTTEKVVPSSKEPQSNVLSTARSLDLDVDPSLLEVGTEIDFGEGLGTTTRTQPILPRLLPRPKRTAWDSDWGDLSWLWAKQSATEGSTAVDKPPYPFLDVRFNERVYLLKAPGMQEQLLEGLQRGLPVPILTVLDYLQHQDGACLRWSEDFREAGYISYFLTVINLSLWSLMNILFLVLPRYGAITMAGMGLNLLITNIVYYAMLPATEMVIHISNTTLRMELGWCYWTILGTGVSALYLGIAMLYYDLRDPGSVTTDLELDSEWRKQLEVHQFQALQRKVRPMISVTDGTAWQTTTPDAKLRAEKRPGRDSKQILFTSDDDSGVNSGSRRALAEEMDKIATDDGSFWKQADPDLELVVIKKRVPEPDGTDDHGLPIFCESMIHHCDTENRLLESIVEEDEYATPASTKRPKGPVRPAALVDIMQENLRRKDQFVKDDEEGKVDRYESSFSSSSSNQESDTSSLWEDQDTPEFFSQSTLSLPIPVPEVKEPTPRRRTQRHQSLGSYHDFGETI